MKSILLTAILVFAAFQDEPPPQPHTNNPGECTRYCYPKGSKVKPKGVGNVEGYECKGDKCAKANDKDAPKDEEMCKESNTCTSFCSAVCCSCLSQCL